MNKENNPKLTKIIATIGPSSESEDIIEKLIKAGVNVFRFNLKHNTLDWHREKIELVNKVAEKLQTTIGILIDLQGPEIRLRIKDEALDLTPNELVLLTTNLDKVNEKAIGLSHPIIDQLKDNQRVVADDGRFEFLVNKKEEKTYLKVVKGGRLKNRKTINFPGIDFNFSSLVDKDFEALKMAALSTVDYVALSFVRKKDDILTLREVMNRYQLKAKVITKIETSKALENLSEIIEVSDGVMVARGDLGVETSFEAIPYWQKKIITQSVKQGKFVITATQMLQSMVSSPIPTRAEISDVANAVFDQTDAVMLSDETASGQYPVEAVSLMEKTIGKAEEFLKESPKQPLIYFPKDQTGYLAMSAMDIAKEIGHKNNFLGFLVLTETGKTAEVLSRFHPLKPIFALSPNQTVVEKLTCYYGVYPFQYQFEKTGEVSLLTLKKIIQFLKDKLEIENGQMIVLHGDYWGLAGGTSVVRIVDLNNIKS